MGLNLPVVAGEYQNATGQEECLRCAAGTYQDRDVEWRNFSGSKERNCE